MFCNLKKFQEFTFQGATYIKLSDDRAMDQAGRIVYVNPREQING